ncbi:MAG: 3-hydroxyacyl-ACP dehydratase FabZ family protein [Terracidiphilus sp.]
MRWLLLDQVLELNPGTNAIALASTRFPDTLFNDHFPGIPITPGVLLIEMAAQLAGCLVAVTASQRDQVLRLPFLTMVREAKFRKFVGPNVLLRIETEIEELEAFSAVCRARVLLNDDRVALMSLMLTFLPEEEAALYDRTLLVAHERSEFMRLGLIGFPPGEVCVAQK